MNIKNTKVTLSELAEVLPRIRIVSEPRGDAPSSVKEKWIGVEIPCLYSDPCAQTKIADLSGRKAKSYASYVVFQVHAIEALEAAHPEAARWWRSMGFPQGDEEVFVFSAESCEALGHVLTRAEFYQHNQSKA
jgi:hypothetical protein